MHGGLGVKGDDSGRPSLDQDLVVRIPIDLLRETGVTMATVKVYAAIRSRVGFEPAAENFMIAWPNERTIAREARVSRAAVIRAVKWLDDHDYIIHDRRPNTSCLFMVIFRRTWFQQVTAQHSRAEAIRCFNDLRSELGGESRHGQAAAACQRRSARHTQSSGRKSQTCNLGVNEGGGGSAVTPLRSQARDTPGSTGTTSEVAAVQHGSVDQVSVRSVIRGAPKAPPASALQDRQNGKGNNNSQSDYDRAGQEIDRAVAALANDKSMPAAEMTESEFEAERRKKQEMAHRCVEEYEEEKRRSSIRAET